MDSESVRGDSGRGDDVYQPDGCEVQDDEGLLDAEDTLLTDALGAPYDPYDEGFPPPMLPLGVEHFGNTAAEQERGESLDELLAEEEPDSVIPVGDGDEEIWEPWDEEPLEDRTAVARVRAGHLVTANDGEAEEEAADEVKRTWKETVKGTEGKGGAGEPS